MNGRVDDGGARAAGAVEREAPLGVLRLGEEVVAEHAAIVGEHVPVGQRLVAERRGIDREVERRRVLELAMVVQIAALERVIGS